MTTTAVHIVVWFELKADLVTVQKMKKPFETIDDAWDWAETINPQGSNGRILPQGGDEAAARTRGYEYTSACQTKSGKWGVVMTKKGHSDIYRKES